MKIDEPPAEQVLSAHSVAPEVRFLYVLRPLLAVRWIDRGPGMQPMRFTDFVRRWSTTANCWPLTSILQLFAETSPNHENPPSRR